jgi:hypothetical protein
MSADARDFRLSFLFPPQSRTYILIRGQACFETGAAATAGGVTKS